MHPQKGQVMLITVLALSGTVLGATTIAGLLMLYQIRQSTDLANSSKAIFAADAGTEWYFYRILKDPNYPKPTFSNQADFEASCQSVSAGAGNGNVNESIVIKSVGKAFNNSRALEASFVREIAAPTSVCK